MANIRAFLDSGILNTTDYRAVTKTSNLYLTYQAWTERDGTEPLGLDDFKQALKKAGYTIKAGMTYGLKEH